MKEPAPPVNSIRDYLAQSPDRNGRYLWGPKTGFSLNELLKSTCLGGRLSELSGCSVLLAVKDQVAAALAMIEMDGVVRRMVVCPPDLSPKHIPAVADRAGVDAVVSDGQTPQLNLRGVLQVSASTVLTPANPVEHPRFMTQWILLTSGTTGIPKLVQHTFASLTAPVRNAKPQAPDTVWGTFYDIRRYGGLQILLRALLGPRSFVFSSADESPSDHLIRLAVHSVTHLTGTPSHWRRTLMSTSANAIAPGYIRLSGEIADQAILNALQSCYPQSKVSHAFASTEAGVGFEVNDGLEGFPADIVGKAGNVDLKIENQSVQLRSDRTATRYLGKEEPTLMDSEGFVDTGDVVELRDGRYYFLGRKSGVIN